MLHPTYLDLNRHRGVASGGLVLWGVKVGLGLCGRAKSNFGMDPLLHSESGDFSVWKFGHHGTRRV